MDEVASYAEDSQQFFSPHFQKGVNNLGDLWHCRNSKAIGHNLFRANAISSEHLRTTLVSNCDYTLTHVKNELETAKSLNIEGHLSLDLLLGIINLDGNLKFQKDESDKTHTEVISCRYINENCRIDVSPPVESLANEHVLQMIADRQIEATHVVGGMIIGCSVTALIEIKSKESKKDWGLSGRLGVSKEGSGKWSWLNKVIGKFSGEVEAEWKEKEKGDQFDIQINCKARPMPSNFPPPNSVKQLFELIERMPFAMSEERHFSVTTGTDGIHGVPIQFILYPIAQFVKINIVKLYKNLEDELMEKFQETLSKAIQIQQHNYIKQILLIRDKQLFFLLDQKSGLSDKVKAFEKNLKLIGKRFVESSRKQLRDYKYGKCGPEEFSRILQEFDVSDAGSVEKKIQELADEGALEIFKAQGTDESETKRFTNDDAKQKWIHKESNPKILFEVGPHCPRMTVTSYHQIVTPLSSIGIKMALVMPSLAQEVKLSLMFADRELVFKDSEVKQAIEILCANFRIGNQAKAEFFAVIAAAKGVEFPSFNSSELDITLQTMIGLVKDYNHFEFVESINDFQRHVRNLDSNHLAFCLPIDAPETALDFFQYWTDYSIKNVTWIVCKFGFDNESETPLLFVLSKTKVLAICLDRLDLLILKKRMESTEISDVSFDLFSVHQLTNSFCKLRASSAYRFLNRVTPSAVPATSENLDKTETNNEVMEFLSFLQRCHKSNPLVILSVVAKMAVYDFPTLISTLKKYGWNDVSKEFTEEVFNKEYCRQMAAELEKWLEDDSMKTEIDKAENLLSDNTCLPLEKRLIINQIVDHSHCPVGFKTQLQQCEHTEKSESVEKVTDILRQLKICDKMTNSHFSFLHIRVLLTALNVFIASEKQNVDAMIKRTLIKEYYENIKRCFPVGVMDKYIQNNQMYLLAQQISPYKYEKSVCALHKGLNILHDFDDCNTLLKFVQELSNVCTNINCIRQMWTNEKWLLLVKNCISMKQSLEDGLLQAILKWIGKLEVRSVLPDDIQQKLNSLEIVTLENFSSVKDIKRCLEKVDSEGGDMPWNFKERLAKTLLHNPSLEADLIKMGAAIHWDSKQKLFIRDWSHTDIKLAIHKIRESLKSTNPISVTTEIDFKLDLGTSLIANEQKSSKTTTSCREHICQKFLQVMGNEFSRFSDKDYLVVRSITNYKCTPHPVQLPSLLPFLLQQIKLWDGNILKASRISNLNANDQDEVMCSDDPFASETQTSSDTGEVSSELKQPLSRLDCIAYILNTVECTVAQEILRVLSKFPLALSLIIPDIREENRFLVALPLLQNIVIRWEVSQKVHDTKRMAIEGSAETGQIVENHLFSSPFRLVVAVRIGTHHTGKSQILNQMMSYSYYFSSHAEAGEKVGPPCTLRGTVEFTWLTEETCSDELWTGLLEEYYASGKNEVVLLANLHGDVLDFPSTVNYLKELASCFIVFLMPNSTRTEWEKLKALISSEPLYIKVDHGNPQISTARLTHKDTQTQIIKVLKSALNQKPNYKSEIIIEVEKPLAYTESIRTTESDIAVELINKYSCSDIKKSMADFLHKGYSGWVDNNKLQLLTKSMLQIFNRSTRLDLKKAVIHLETELSKKSAKESIIPRRKVIEAQRQLQLAKFGIKGKSEGQNPSDDRTEMLNKKMTEESIHVNEANLGLEHFYRIFGEIYRISLGQYSSNTNNVENLPQYYADLLLSGHSLEILNGDTGEIPLDWLRAISQQVNKRQPHLRVFVISIIGIQSSGKSTLLNALFSCRFAVSVGRCSRGLYMRMVFLEEDLMKKVGYDAIILIDTEGLASSEKMNESDAERKDRLLATFAMGLSNLTIVNVLGEELTSMTEILQIVVVAMARLQQADIKPDMIVVQHLQERNSSKLNEAKCQFINAIKAAFDLVNKCDVDLGATQNACLEELIRRIEHPNMFFQFSSFKDGSSVHAPPSESYHNDVAQLYQNLLARAEAAPCKLSFERWFQLVENYWNSVTNEKFALNFKNAKKISDFLHYGQKVATIKELVGKAFGFHQDELSKKVTEKVSQYLSQKKENELEQLRKELTSEAVYELNHVPYNCLWKICGCCKQLQKQIEELLLEVNETDLHKDIDKSIKKCIESKMNNELKILSQQFDVLVLHNNVSTETIQLINDEIKKEFERCTKNTSGDNNAFRNYSENEKTAIINSIWDRVTKIAQSKATGAPLMEEIEKAIDNEYRYSHPGIYEEVKRNLAEEILENETAKSNTWFFRSGKLSHKEHSRLVEKVENFVKDILTKSGYNTQGHKVGMKFEAIMIMTIKHNIRDMIQEFEKECKVQLKPEFRHLIIVHTLCTFIRHMEPIHEKWENQNKPNKILIGKENFYKAEIKTRLEHGFSCASDGFVKAGYIIEAVKKKTIDAGYRTKVQSILDHTWMTNSEKVRLQYFEELALEVKEKNIDRSIAHFSNPKQSVEKWFKEKLEKIYSKEKVRERFKETLKKEEKYILDEIIKSRDFNDLKTLLIQYQVPVTADDNDGEKTGLKEHDFITYRDSIKCKIEELSRQIKHNHVEYPSASDDSEVMSRLGCTESCPWCGALCWGSRGHHDDEGEIKKHHTCHQPNGLIRTLRVYYSRQILDPRACQDIPDKEPVLEDPKKGLGMPWGAVKVEYFGNWKFDSHAIKKFDEMMRWFFQELQTDIAKYAGYDPAPENMLKRYGCEGLKLEDILVAVRSVKN